MSLFLAVRMTLLSHFLAANESFCSIEYSEKKICLNTSHVEQSPKTRPFRFFLGHPVYTDCLDENLHLAL